MKSFGEPFMRWKSSTLRRKTKPTHYSAFGDDAAAVAQARKLPLETVRAAVNRGISTADSMLGNHLSTVMPQEQEGNSLSNPANVRDEGDKEATCVLCQWMIMSIVLQRLKKLR